MIKGSLEQQGKAIFIKNEFFHGILFMKEIIHFGRKIRNIALLFPKTSQNELFPTYCGK